MKEKIFGPVAPVFKFETEEEAVPLANDTESGFACYFYTGDLGRAFRSWKGTCGPTSLNVTLLAGGLRVVSYVSSYGLPPRQPFRLCRYFQISRYTRRRFSGATRQAALPFANRPSSTTARLKSQIWRQIVSATFWMAGSEMSMLVTASMPLRIVILSKSLFKTVSSA